MTAPRPRYPGEAGMITRRTTQRQFLLRPDAAVTNALGYIVGHEQMQYGFEINAAVFLSNHKHVVGRDLSENEDHSEVANIERDTNSLIARAINKYRERNENLWAAGGRTFNFVETPEPEDKLREMAYVLNNPVEAELVDDFRKWPGLLLEPGPSGRRVYRFTRPNFFFTEDMPAETYVVVTAPFIVGYTPREVMDDVYARVNTLKAEVRARVEVEGRRFMGAKRVLRQSVNDCAVTPEESPTRRPRYASHDLELRRLLIIRDQTWAAHYEQARQELRAGNRDAVFPYGTYQVVEDYCLDCASIWSLDTG